MDKFMTTIGQVAELFDGPHATPVKTDDGPIFLSISSLESGRLDLSKSARLGEGDFKKWTKRVTPRKGDLLFSYETRLGEAALMPDGVRACLGRRMGLLRPRSDKVIPEYLLYAYLSPAFQQTIVANTITGATVDRVALSEMPDFPIRIPGMDEQKKVAGLLKDIDAKIDCNNRINAELEAMAKTLYDYWFVQFDFPDAHGKPYKSSGGKMVYSSTLKGEIPEGWEVVPLSDWIASDKTGDWGKEAAEGNYTLCVGCIRGTDINGLNGKGALSPPIRFILKKNSTKVLAPFDFVIEISGGSPTQSTGRLALITEETFERFSRPLICSNFCKAISLKDRAYFFNFAYLWKSAYNNKVLFGWEGKTSGIKNLLFDAFTTKHLVSRPPQELAKRFFQFIAPVEAKKQKLLQETEDLAALRDWLLPLLMNGQVTVA